MSDEREKLIKRIEHWAEHNDEHTSRYEESAKEAKNIDLTESAQYLLKAGGWKTGFNPPEERTQKDKQRIGTPIV